MNNIPDDGLDSDWDDLLRDGLLKPPADFQARVMYSVHHESSDAKTLPALTDSLTTLLQSAAVIIAAFAAGWQTFAFVFGLWATSVAI